MSRLTGIILTQLMEVSMPQQPRWIGKTVTGEDVVIKYDHGTLVVTFSGDTEGFVAEVGSPDSIEMTTEVMLLVTGLKSL